MNNLKLLIKFPTRGRPKKFFSTLDSYYGLMITDNFQFVITCDNDDLTMNNCTVRERLALYRNLKVHYGDSRSKIEAVNNNIAGYDFDILLVASDDMVPVVRGYDAYIKYVYKNILPSDTDQVVWFNDGNQGKNLNTLSIMGKKFYERYGYVYNPIYKSLYCDLEFTEIIKQLKRFIYFENVIIKHAHYSVVGEAPDSSYVENNRFHDRDLATFRARQRVNFDLPHLIGAGVI